MLSYTTVQTERQWKATTGFSSKTFYRLSEQFGATYVSINGVSLESGAKNLNTELLLPTYQDCLFFVLFQLKNGLSYDALGFLINTDSTNAERNFEKYLSILDITLTDLGCTPRRDFANLEEFEQYLSSQEELTIDVTEHATQRPKGYARQKEAYSGKKTTILTKNS